MQGVWRKQHLSAWPDTALNARSADPEGAAFASTGEYDVSVKVVEAEAFASMGGSAILAGSVEVCIALTCLTLSRSHTESRSLSHQLPHGVVLCQGLTPSRLFRIRAI